VQLLVKVIHTFTNMHGDATSLPLYKQQGWEQPAGSSFPFLKATVALMLTVYTMETYLDIRQHRKLRATQPPATLLSTLKRVDDSSATKPDSSSETLVAKATEKFNKSQAYGRDKSLFGFVGGFLKLLMELASLLLGLQPYLWDKSLALNDRFFGQDKTVSVIQVSLIFLGLSMIVEELTSLPFSLYSTFVVEHRHNFNKQTPALFLVDKLKGLALTAAVGAPLMATALWIIGSCGQYFFAYLWALLFCFALLAMTVYPTVIAPMFNKYTPLEAGPLREGIEALARRVNYPLTQLFVVDGSTRSAHSNAYCYGFGRNKRIVLVSVTAYIYIYIYI
jgi:STE24 endopeptidase